jgi:hypothetical protein
MDSDSDDGLGPSSFLGLNKILQSAGVDVAEFTTAFNKAGPSSHGLANDARARAFAEVEDSDEDAAYMDDELDADLRGDDYGETAEERSARERAAARAKADEEKWLKRGMEMQQQAEVKARKKKVDRARDEAEGKELTTLEKIRQVWPGWQPGQTMRLSEVFYQSPLVKQKEEAEGRKRKRAHFGVQDKDVVLPQEIQCEWAHRVGRAAVGKAAEITASSA